MEINSYKDLIVWQKSIELVVAIYELTEKYPKTEIFGLISQMRRAAVSISSNIAEGKNRGTKKDYCCFVVRAFASGSELETQIIISKRLLFGKDFDYNKVDGLLSEVMKMLNSLIKKLNVSD